MEEEPGEKRTRLGPTQGNLAARVPHLERSQDPELHLTGLPARDANTCCASETDLKRAGSIIGFDMRADRVSRRYENESSTRHPRRARGRRRDGRARRHHSGLAFV